MALNARVLLPLIANGNNASIASNLLQGSASVRVCCAKFAILELLARDNREQSDLAEAFLTSALLSERAAITAWVDARAAWVSVASPIASTDMRRVSGSVLVKCISMVLKEALPSLKRDNAEAKSRGHSPSETSSGTSRLPHELPPLDGGREFPES